MPYTQTQLAACKRYRKRHPDRVAAANKNWRTRNRQKVRDRQKRYAIKHPDRIKALRRKWYDNNRERAAELSRRSQDRRSDYLRNYNREWKTRNPDKVVDYGVRRLAKLASDPELRKRVRLQKSASRKLRIQNDPRFRATSSLRTRLHLVVRRSLARKHSSTESLLGCPIRSFMLYLESKFEPGMCWENYGQGRGKWNIDHIVPCSIFDLAIAGHQRACFHFSNLQPLWSEDNRAKSNKYDGVLPAILRMDDK